MRYLLSMMEKDFDEEIHALTGLIDKNARPIVRCKYDEEKIYPIGFGRQEEWSRFESLTSPDTRSPS